MKKARRIEILENELAEVLKLPASLSRARTVDKLVLDIELLKRRPKKETKWKPPSLTS
jgi:hypothetical protein